MAKLATIYAQARFQIVFGIIASFVSNSVLYLVLVVFLLGGGECYLVTVDFDSFSGRTCILILLDEQRHLVGRF